MPIRPPGARARWATLTAAVGSAILVTLGLTVMSTGSPSAVGPTATAAPTLLAELSPEATPLASGLDRPTAIAAPDDGSDRLFVTEKPGTVRAYHPDSGLADDALLDVSDRLVDDGNEQGLLGLAPAPDFADSEVLYAAYTAAPDGELTLSRFTLAGGAAEAAATEEVLLTEEHPEFANHNGGQLAFDSAGLLYWSLGDGGGAGDPQDHGQDPGTLLGTIVRLDVSAACDGLAYCVPDDNPFVGDAEAREEVWAYGLRNAWRFSVDVDDSLWIGDVGQGGYEEVNHQPADAGGANFGWSCMEGPEVFEEERCAEDADLVDPVFAYPTSIDGCAIIGGHVYRGQNHADVADGVYVATDYCTGNTWGVVEQDGQYTGEMIGELPIQATSIGVDTAGEQYLVTDLPGELYALSF